MGTEAITQPLCFGNPYPHELRPHRVGEFDLIAMLDHPLAEPVQRLRVRL